MLKAFKPYIFNIIIDNHLSTFSPNKKNPFYPCFIGGLHVIGITIYLANPIAVLHDFFLFIFGGKFTLFVDLEGVRENLQPVLV